MTPVLRSRRVQLGSLCRSALCVSRSDLMGLWVEKSAIESSHGGDEDSFEVRCAACARRNGMYLARS
jgi:hypothetical protein